MQNKTSDDFSGVRMTELMTPGDANFLGKVFGGAILSLLDKVAYVTASRHAGGICVTASFDRVDFHSPIEVGELVHCVGQVAYVGRTSLLVKIEVFAENLHTHSQRHTNSCWVTMVAIDERGKPVQVPPLSATTREQKIEFLKGHLLRELRKKQQNEFHQMIEEIESLPDEALESRLQQIR